MGVVFVRKVIHLATNFFGATGTSFCTSSCVNGRCSVLHVTVTVGVAFSLYSSSYP